MKKVEYILICLIIMSSVCNIYASEVNSNKHIFGGEIRHEDYLGEDLEVVSSKEEDYDLNRFFRPSDEKILNDQNLSDLEEFYNKNPYKIQLPETPFRSGKDTVVNYFNVLREAANPIESTNTGCGTLGEAEWPYPVAYNFLSESYKKKLSYKEFLKSFENMLHINLIKVNNVPSDKDKPNLLKYFVELEVIEGSLEKKGLFAYYYGNIYLEKEKDGYKIVDMNYSPENYLCAPYHGWAYDAKQFVEIEYGEWNSLIKGDVIVNQDGYQKRAYYKDKDNNEYYVLFYELTNGVDKKIADFKKDKDNKWQVIYVNPEKNIKNKS